MNLYDVIKKPVITEKSMIALEAGKYTFETKKAIITLTADSKAIELFAAEAE